MDQRRQKLHAFLLALVAIALWLLLAGRISFLSDNTLFTFPLFMIALYLGLVKLFPSLKSPSGPAHGMWKVGIATVGVSAVVLGAMAYVAWVALSSG